MTQSGSHGYTLSFFFFALKLCTSSRNSCRCCDVALQSAAIPSACCLAEMAGRRQSDGRPAPSSSCLRSRWRRSITSACRRHSHVIEETVMSDLCWQLCYEVCGCKVSGRAAKEFPRLIDLGGRGAEWRIYASVTATKRTAQPRLAQCSLNRSILYYIFGQLASVAYVAVSGDGACMWYFN